MVSGVALRRASTRLAKHLRSTSASMPSLTECSLPAKTAPAGNQAGLQTAAQAGQAQCASSGPHGVGGGSSRGKEGSSVKLGKGFAAVGPVSDGNCIFKRQFSASASVGQNIEAAPADASQEAAGSSSLTGEDKSAAGHSGTGTLSGVGGSDDDEPTRAASSAESPESADSGGSKSGATKPPPPLSAEDAAIVNLSLQSFNMRLGELISKSLFQEALKTFRIWSRGRPQSQGQAGSGAAAEEGQGQGQGQGQGEGGLNQPSVMSYNFLLHAMMRSNAELPALMRVMSEIRARGLKPNTLTYNTLLRVHFRRHDSHEAEAVLRQMEASGPEAQPDGDSYNLLVAVCAMERRAGSALIHLQSMLQRGYNPSKTTYNELLAACARTRRTRDALAILKELRLQGVMPLPSVISDLLISASEEEDAECAVWTLRTIASRQIGCDEGSLLLAINVAARTGNVELVEEAWRILSAVVKPQEPLPPFHLARIHCYATAGNLTSTFRGITEYDTAWRTRAPTPLSGPRFHPGPISSALHPAAPPAPAPAAAASPAAAGVGADSSSGSKGDPELFNPRTSLHPVTLAVSRGLGVLDNAYFKLADMHAEGELVSLASLNCVVAGCSQLRDADRAQQTFDEIERTFGLVPDVHSYNALIDVYGKRRQIEEAAKRFEEMKAKGVEPSADSFAFLTDAYIMSFDPRGATNTVKAMLEAGHVPSRSLLMRLLRRSKREGFTEGAHYAKNTIDKIGYRQASSGEHARRVNLYQGYYPPQQHTEPRRQEQQHLRQQQHQQMGGGGGGGQHYEERDGREREQY